MKKEELCTSEYSARAHVHDMSQPRILETINTEYFKASYFWSVHWPLPNFEKVTDYRKIV